MDTQSYTKHCYARSYFNNLTAIRPRCVAPPVNRLDGTHAQPCGMRLAPSIGAKEGGVRRFNRRLIADHLRCTIA